MVMMSIYTFPVESMIRGYHKYKVVWDINQLLKKIYYVGM